MPLLDLSNADDTFKFNPLPDGTYSAKIKEVSLGEAKKGGKLPEDTAVISVQFEIDEDEIPEAEVEIDDEGNEKTIPYSTRVFSNYNIVKDKSYQHKQTMDNILYGFLKAAGYDVEDLKSGEFELDLDDLPGRKVQVNLVINSYEKDGETRTNNRVKFVKEAGAGAGLI
jgi:hypothetical protein